MGIMRIKFNNKYLEMIIIAGIRITWHFQKLKKLNIKTWKSSKCNNNIFRIIIMYWHHQVSKSSILMKKTMPQEKLSYPKLEGIINSSFCLWKTKMRRRSQLLSLALLIGSKPAKIIKFQILFKIINLTKSQKVS